MAKTKWDYKEEVDNFYLESDDNIIQEGKTPVTRSLSVSNQKLKDFDKLREALEKMFDDIYDTEVDLIDFYVWKPSKRAKTRFTFDMSVFGVRTATPEEIKKYKHDTENLKARQRETDKHTLSRIYQRNPELFKEFK